jgi:hypothetical protein
MTKIEWPPIEYVPRWRKFADGIKERCPLCGTQQPVRLRYAQDRRDPPTGSEPGWVYADFDWHLCPAPNDEHARCYGPKHYMIPVAGRHYPDGEL